MLFPAAGLHMHNPWLLLCEFWFVDRVVRVVRIVRMVRMVLLAEGDTGRASRT